MAVSAIVGGVAAAATVASTAYGMAGGGGGGGGDSPYAAAAQLQYDAAIKGQQLQKEMYEQARADVAPWRTAGTAAVGQIAGLEGLPGYTPVDPTATLKATPGYEWMLGQGVSALDKSAASRGLALSGAQRKGVTDYGQNLALNKAWAPYMSTLQGLSTTGAAAASQTGSWAMQTGENQAQLGMTAAQAQAQGLINQYNASQQQQQAFWQNLMGGLGLGGGMAKGLPGMGGGGTPSGGAGGPFTAANVQGYEVPYGSAALDYSTAGSSFFTAM